MRLPSPEKRGGNLLVGKLEITSDSVKAESSRNLSRDEKENYEEQKAAKTFCDKFVTHRSTP